MTGYYLSKANRKILELFIPILESKQEDFCIEIKNPDRLEKILKNANGYEIFRWIGNKFSFSVKSDRIFFKLRIPKEYKIIEDIPENNLPLDFFSLFSILLTFPPTTKFIDVTLTNDELERIKSWCKEYKYQVEYINYTFTLKKDVVN